VKINEADSKVDLVLESDRGQGKKRIFFRFPILGNVVLSTIILTSTISSTRSGFSIIIFKLIFKYIFVVDVT